VTVGRRVAEAERRRTSHWSGPLARLRSPRPLNVSVRTTDRTTRGGPENVLQRITFYDIDSNLIERQLTDRENRLYLREIKKDLTYFGKTYARAHLRIDIAGLDVAAAARRIKESVELHAAP
jgi:hypothetical protein